MVTFKGQLLPCFLPCRKSGSQITAGAEGWGTAGVCTEGSRRQLRPPSPLEYSPLTCLGHWEDPSSSEISTFSERTRGQLTQGSGNQKWPCSYFKRSQKPTFPQKLPIFKMLVTSSIFSKYSLGQTFTTSLDTPICQGPSGYQLSVGPAAHRSWRPCHVPSSESQGLAVWFYRCRG